MLSRISSAALARTNGSGLTGAIQSGKPALVDIDDVDRPAERLAGVRCAAPRGLAEWRYLGRVVARQLDDIHLVIRADFD